MQRAGVGTTAAYHKHARGYSANVLYIYVYSNIGRPTQGSGL